MSDKHRNTVKGKQNISMRLDKYLVAQLDEATKNYKNSGVDISRTTFIRIAIEEKLEREKS